MVELQRVLLARNQIGGECVLGGDARMPFINDQLAIEPKALAVRSHQINRMGSRCLRLK